MSLFCGLLLVTAANPSMADSRSDSQRAEEYWLRAAQRMGDNPDSYRNAMSSITAAMALRPHNAKYMTEKAHILFDAEEDEEAMKLVERALKEDPTFSRAWNLKGLILTRSRKFEQAKSCSDMAVKLEPKNAFNWLDRAHMLATANRWDEAGKASDEAAKIMKSKVS